jgi:site-specific recombinase XerD
VSEYDLIRQWEEFMLAQGRSPVTIRQYRYGLHRLASETSPPKPLTEVTEQDVVVFLATLQKKAASRQLYMRGFKSFFTWAHQRGHMDHNPAEHIHPKAPTERAPDAFSPEEVGMLMKSAANFSTGKRDAAAIQLCYALGLRRSELCAIRPEDVDWVGRRVYIRPSKGDKDRWVEVNNIAYEALKLLEPWYNGTVIGSLAPQWFTMLVHRAAKQAGFPPGRRNAHMLRASFITNLIDNGGDITVVSKLVGHSNLATTMRYRAIRQPARRDTVAMLSVPA